MSKKFNVVLYQDTRYDFDVYFVARIGEHNGKTCVLTTCAPTNSLSITHHSNLRCRVETFNEMVSLGRYKIIGK